MILEEKTGVYNIGQFLMALLMLCVLILSVACGEEHKKEVLTEVTSTTVPQSTVMSTRIIAYPTTKFTELESLVWQKITDKDEILTISLPSKWETVKDAEILNQKYPELREQGVVLNLTSMDTETGDNLIVLLDFGGLLNVEDTSQIQAETYVLTEIERLRQSGVASRSLRTQPVIIDGIEGTQLDTYSSRGLALRTNVLVGGENDLRILCGYIGVLIHGIAVDGDFEVIDKAIESFHILPNLAKNIDSCSDVPASFKSVLLPRNGSTGHVVNTNEVKNLAWERVADENKIFSMVLPSKWETTVGTDDLAQRFPQLVEVGVVPLLTSIDPETGNNLLMLMDTQYLLKDDGPQPIDMETYVQMQIKDLEQTSGISRPIEVQPIIINGIEGMRLNYTIHGLSGRTNVLVGGEDELRMLCGHIGVLIQGIAVDGDFEVIDKAMASLRILPSAAGDINSCDDISGA